MKIICASVVIVAALTSIIVPATADEVTKACLAKRVALSNITMVPGSFGRDIAFDVTNTLPYAISGLYFRATATSEGRSVAWYDDTMSIVIAGGVEPGETRHIKGYSLHIDSDAPETLTLSLTTEDVADPEKHPVNAEIRFLSWAPGKSALTCE